jgi:hypothetical protein
LTMVAKIYYGEKTASWTNADITVFMQFFLWKRTCNESGNVQRYNHMEFHFPTYSPTHNMVSPYL